MPLTTITRTWPLLLGMGVLMLGAGLQSTLLGIRATLEAFPTTVTGDRHGVLLRRLSVGHHRRAAPDP